MPKDESRRRVKERLRPYVKVSPPGVVLLNFSMFHNFCCRIILLVIWLTSCWPWILVRGELHQLKAAFWSLNLCRLIFCQAGRRQCAEPRPSVERPDALLAGEDAGQSPPVHVWIQRPHKVSTEVLQKITFSNKKNGAHQALAWRLVWKDSKGFLTLTKLRGCLKAT